MEQHYMKQLAAGMAKVQEGLQLLEQGQLSTHLPDDKKVRYMQLRQAALALTPETKLVFPVDFAAALAQVQKP